MKLEQISEDMFRLGKKFSEIADSAKSVREAKMAFEMACKAYGLCVNAEDKLGSSLTDYNLLFISGIDTRIKRSEVWLMYSAFCAEHKCSQLRKGEFFDFCNRVGFSIRRMEGDHYVIPPKQLSEELRAARKKLERLASPSLLLGDGSGPHES